MSRRSSGAAATQALQPARFADEIDDATCVWGRLVPGSPTGPLLVYERLRRAEAVLTERVAAVERAHGLGRGEYDVLAALRLSEDAPARSATWLATELELTTGQVTHRLNSLEALGLIAREGSAHDRRVKWVHLLPPGRDLVERLHVERVALLARCLQRLDGRTQRALGLVLRDVHAESA